MFEKYKEKRLKYKKERFRRYLTQTRKLASRTVDRTLQMCEPTGEEGNRYSSQCRNRPGVAQRVPGNLGSQIS
jgi:hypothetical protein